MRILLTGSSGHIGRAIARHLWECGHDIVGVSRTVCPSLPPELVQIALDITRESFCEAIQVQAGKCDAVIHAAACLDSTVDVSQITRTNCLGTHQVLQAAMAMKASCFLYISGLNILGLPVEHPITEAHPINPLDAYAASKYYGELLVRFAGTASMRTLSLRPSSPVGSGLHRKRIFRLFVENALNNTALTLHGTGARRQDYVDVRDVALAVQLALEKECHGIYNVGSGIPVSNRTLAEIVISTLNSSSEWVFTGHPDPEEALCWDLCIEKARHELGYAPRYSLEQSIKELASEITAGASMS